MLMVNDWFEKHSVESQNMILSTLVRYELCETYLEYFNTYLVPTITTPLGVTIETS